MKLYQVCNEYDEILILCDSCAEKMRSDGWEVIELNESESNTCENCWITDDELDFYDAADYYYDTIMDK